MPLSCIIFDCDGIILESVDAKAKAYIRLAEPFGKDAVQRFREYEAMHRGVSRYEKFTWFFQEVLGRAITQDELADWSERFVAYSDTELSSCEFVPGFQDVLQTWHGRVPLYVASGTPQLYLERLLEEKGIADAFSRIYGTPPGKTERVRQALSHARIAHPSSAVMVGDSPVDMDAAERAGTLFYGRGVYFRESGYPWHTDLTRLNDYLESVARDDV